MKVEEYPAVKADITQLVDELRIFFRNADYEVQVRRESPVVIVQARKSSKIRDLTGTSYALTIQIIVNESGTQVAIGKQKWLDKAAVGIAAVLLTGGFGLLPVALGTYNQYHITDEAWNVVKNHIARKSGGAVYGSVECPGCGTTNTDSRFCPNCGTKLM